MRPLVVIVLLAALGYVLTQVPLGGNGPLLDLDALLKGSAHNGGQFDINAGGDRGKLETLMDHLPGPFGDEQAAEAGETTRFYRWTDAEGNVQFTSEPPPDGVSYTRQEVYNNVNVLPSLNPQGQQGGEAQGTSGGQQRSSAFSAYHAAGDKAHEANRKQEKRNNMLEQMLTQ